MEIKFRAYIDKAHSNEVFSEGMHEWEDVKSWVYLWEMLNEKTIVLLQYSGLKDEQGKEIYEGDEVQYPDEEFGDWIGTVENIDGVFTADGGNPLRDECRKGHVKIIGNVYKKTN